MTPEEQERYNENGLCPKCSSPTMYYCSAEKPEDCPLQADDDDDEPEAVTGPWGKQ